ncbi:hypothetical protein TNCV_2886261 [Trichonephila clavipes]|nr:hypothetical protein TNCV_2886261 [Trichonephila clavipes]
MPNQLAHGEKGRPNLRWTDDLEKDFLVLRTKNWRTLAGRRLACVKKGFLRRPRPTLGYRATEEGTLLQLPICMQSSKSGSDEAHFWLNGYVNKQNCRIWSEANPQVYVETPLHSEKLTVWCALWAGGILLQKG